MNVHSKRFLILALLTLLGTLLAAWCTFTTTWETLSAGKTKYQLGLYRLCGDATCVSPSTSGDTTLGKFTQKLSETPGWAQPRVYAAVAMPISLVVLGLSVIVSFIATLLPSNWSAAGTRKLIILSLTTSILLLAGATFLVTAAVVFTDYNRAIVKDMGKLLDMPGKDLWIVGGLLTKFEDTVNDKASKLVDAVYQLDIAPKVTIAVASFMYAVWVFSLYVIWKVKTGAAHKSGIEMRSAGY